MTRTQEFTIEGRLTGLNAYVRRERANRFAAAELKRIEEARIAKAVKEQGIEKLVPPVRVQIDWYESPKKKGAKMRDKDNISFAVKFVLDALQKTGVLPNDGWDEIASISHKFYRAPLDAGRVVVRIEDKGGEE